MGDDARKFKLPLVRFLSAQVTPYLVKTPLSANQITTASLGLGCAALWYFHLGDPVSILIGSGFFILSYILDNCDGEVARYKNQASPFGRRFDSFVDWVVSSGFFAALGLGYARITGNEIWLWLGWIAMAGGSINYFLGIGFEIIDKRANEEDLIERSDSVVPEGAFQWFIYLFRELARADFCFLVLILAAFDVLWVLLPAAAVGAQVYWLLLCLKSARRFRV